MSFPRQGDNFRTLTAKEAAPILLDWCAHVQSTKTPAERFNSRFRPNTPERR